MNPYGSASGQNCRDLFSPLWVFKYRKLSCSVCPLGVTLTARLHTARSKHMLSFLNSVTSCYVLLCGRQVRVWTDVSAVHLKEERGASGQHVYLFYQKCERKFN